MTFDKSFVLQQMADTARQQFQLNMTRVDKVDDLLVRQMNGQSMGKIIAGTLFSGVWAAVYIFLFVLSNDMIYSPLPGIAMGVSLLLMLLHLIWQFSRIRYYGSISQTRSQLFRMRDRLEDGEKALSTDLRDFSDSRTSGWMTALNPGESIPEELDIMEQTVSNMVAMQSGLLQKAKLVFYYLSCLAWTVVGCLCLEELLYTFFGGDFSAETIHTLMIIGMVLSLIVEVFVARFLWSQTDCTVTNLTIFATCAGPIIFFLLALAAALIVAVVSFIISLLAGALALIIGGSILYGFCCGG